MKTQKTKKHKVQCSLCDEYRKVSRRTYLNCIQKNHFDCRKCADIKKRLEKRKADTLYEVFCPICGDEKFVHRATYCRYKRTQRVANCNNCAGKVRGEKQQGENNNNWMGGITPKRRKIRNSKEYKGWRKACLERDNFTCQKTGISGGKLVVHHINNFADYPELRLAINNGIVLSEKAHKDFHKIYGFSNNTKQQIIEFTKIK